MKARVILGAMVLVAALTLTGLLPETAFAQDTDGDGVPDEFDNCPTDWNPFDADEDGQDWEDPIDGADNDSDTLIDEDYEMGQEDLDDDGNGDVCDIDDDGDWFTDDDELYVGTDPMDDCPDVLGTPGLCPGPSCDGDDAWPPDLDVDRDADIVDVLKFRPVILTLVPPSPQRFDFDADGDIDIVDVLKYGPVILTSCTNE